MNDILEMLDRLVEFTALPEPVTYMVHPETLKAWVAAGMVEMVDGKPVSPDGVPVIVTESVPVTDNTMFKMSGKINSLDYVWDKEVADE